MSAYGPAYVEGTNVFRLLAITAVLIAVNNVVGQAIISKGKIWPGLFLNALSATTLLISASILIHSGRGALGFAWATVFSYACHTIWQAAYLAWVLRAEATSKTLHSRIHHGMKK
jgi:O-antigen/teichoic acid export membrane protein